MQRQLQESFAARCDRESGGSESWNGGARRRHHGDLISLLNATVGHACQAAVRNNGSHNQLQSINQFIFVTHKQFTVQCDQIRHSYYM